MRKGHPCKSDEKVRRIINAGLEQETKTMQSVVLQVSKQLSWLKLGLVLANEICICRYELGSDQKGRSSAMPLARSHPHCITYAGSKDEFI